MKSRRVHRVRTAQRQAMTTVETYRASSRGLNRVFRHILPGEDSPAGMAAARAAHHLAEVEALLPRVREAIRSCRYPGAEHGDPAALVWGLWSHLSETLLHVKGALQSLEVLGQRYRYRNEDAAAEDLRTAARGLGKTNTASESGTGSVPAPGVARERKGKEAPVAAKKRKAKKKPAKKKKAKKKKRR